MQEQIISPIQPTEFIRDPRTLQPGDVIKCEWGHNYHTFVIRRVMTTRLIMDQLDSPWMRDCDKLYRFMQPESWWYLRKANMWDKWRGSVVNPFFTLLIVVGVVTLASILVSLGFAVFHSV